MLGPKSLLRDFSRKQKADRWLLIPITNIPYDFTLPRSILKQNMADESLFTTEI